MTFIQVPADQDAGSQAAALFAADRETAGYVANLTRLFALRPAVYQAWRQLSEAIKANMDPYRYELTTLAAARRLRSSYCALAHGKILRDRFCDAETVRGIADGQAKLDPADAAVMDFADKVAGDAASVTAHDVAALRAHGLRDSEILDVTLATAARCFFSTVLEAMGTEPDAAYRTELEPELQRALTVGRPIARAGNVAGQRG
jgi:uncharacterized peroxidase-related enzyme